jgi:hypothetical protein
MAVKVAERSIAERMKTRLSAAWLLTERGSCSGTLPAV